MSSDKYISFTELYTKDFEITDIFAMCQKWIEGAVFKMEHPRKSSAVLYLNGCSGLYKSPDGETFDAPIKSLICLPYGSRYTVLNHDCQKSHPDAYLVEFNIVKDGKILSFSDFPFIIGGKNSCLSRELVKKAVSCYTTPVRSPAAVRSAVYNLLSTIGKEELSEYNKKYRTIVPAIRLLEEDPSVDYSVEELSASCSVSEGCFRRLFKEYTGKSPVEYRTYIKINIAKNLLENPCITVESISDALGYESPAYFCRVFKKKTGITPSEYRKKQYLI